MDKQSSPELSFKNKNVASSMELQLLPSGVLHDIVSRLSIKEVVRMSVLSRQWRQLGICHPDLVFTRETFFGSSNTARCIDPPASMVAEFITKVDNVLRPLWSTAGTTTTLDKFVIKFKLGRKHKYHIDRWISFSTMSRAKHIALDFTIQDSGSEDDKYLVPLCNLSGPNGSCVKSLYLGYVCLKLQLSFCGITNLKNLTLNSVSISTGDLQCLLLRCALLESLSIEWCSFSSLCIRQELCRLQYLCVRNCELKMIELHAPNLTKFEFDDDVRQITLSESLKLSEATFVSNWRGSEAYDYDLSLIFYELPPALPHLHKLFLLLNLDQVLMFSDTQTSFINLRHLNMTLDIFHPWDTTWVTGLVNLLELAPLLEEFELHIDYGTSCLPDPMMVTAVQGPLLHHLRRVYMSGFSDVLGLAELAIYILGNATVLERMVVDPVGRIKYDRSTCRFYPASNFSSNKEFVLPPSPTTKKDMFCITEKRMFAKKHLERKEFRHIVTIL